MSEAVKKPNQTSTESYQPKTPEIACVIKEAQREASYPEAFTLPDKSTVITGETRRNCPGYVTFANDFSYFMDYSGQGYGFIHRNENWRCDINYTLADIITGYAMRPSCLEVTQEGLDRLYAAVGYPSRQTFYADSSKGEFMSEAGMKEAIKYTLCTLGQPVLLSPIESRFFGAIVIGYKDGGNVLITFGYPPYFIAPDNTQPQIEDITDWYKDSTALTIIGKRQKALPDKELYYQGIHQIYNYLKEGVKGKDSHYYDEWENILRLESMNDMITEVRRLNMIPGAQMFSHDLQEENIRDQMNALADPTWCEMSERRYYIMHFFYQAKQHFPEEAEAFQTLEDHFWRACEIMGNQQNGYIGEVGHDPVNAEAFENPEVRARMADCVRQFRDADAKGLDMVEKLLAIIRRKRS